MTEHLTNWITEGHFRLSGRSAETGECRVFIDKPNKIMYPSTEIVARGLAGLPNAAVSHLYLAYNNDDAYPANGYTISEGTTAFQKDAASGYLRIPITLPPTITPAGNGSYQTVTFTVLISQPDAFKVTGSPNLSNSSDFFEAALVCQTDPNGSVSNTTGDRVFSRVAFQRLQYDSTFNLSISWAIKLSI
jgi:hypothetical protein